MNTAPIERYATWARTALLEAVELRARHYDLLGEDVAPLGSDVVCGRVLTAQERTSRDRLMRRMVEKGEKGESAVLEEAAYTWFNRLVAIRYMEVHNFLPSRTRMLSTEEGRFEPPVLNEALTVNLPSLDRDYVAQAMSDSDDEALYKMLLIAQCDQLADALPQVFQHVGAADELLLPDGLLRQDGFIGRLVTDIPLDCWESVEILGWMYQYFNRDVRASLQDKNVGAGEIGPATQVYTPEWIVRFMVDNSLGLLWMLNHPDSHVKDKMTYYIESTEAITDFERINSPEEIRILDPACGSGHILIYVFNLLFAMYLECGYRMRDIPSLIIEKNLEGFEIDERAVQISTLALSLMAREYDRRFFLRGLTPNVTLLDSVVISKWELEGLPLQSCDRLLESLAHLDQCGSMLLPTSDEMQALEWSLASFRVSDDLSSINLQNRIGLASKHCRSLFGKYHIVIANPPFRASNKTSSWLKDWMKEYYPYERSDMCAVFLKRMTEFCMAGGLVGSAATISWMFNSTYERARKSFIEKNDIVALVQLSVHGYEKIATQVFAATTIGKQRETLKGSYIRLEEFDHHTLQGPKTLEAIRNHHCGWFYKSSTEDFSHILGTPIVYWASQAVLTAFDAGDSFKDLAHPIAGITTGDNNRYYRKWWEVDYSRIRFDATSLDDTNDETPWYPCDKGGEYRKWYGNRDNIILFGPSARNEMSHLPGYRPVNLSAQFKDKITWSDVTSGDNSFRRNGIGIAFDQVGKSACPDSERINEILGFANSGVARILLRMVSPGLHCNTGDIAKLPVLYDDGQEHIESLVSQCIRLSRADYDSTMISWDFLEHPLIAHSGGLLADLYEAYKRMANARFDSLQNYEAEINRHYLMLYGMTELASERPENRYVSITRVFDTSEDIPTSFVGNTFTKTRQQVIRSLVDYSVGCMFGRYSLEENGLRLPNQRAVSDCSLTPSFSVGGGIIPITDNSFFKDDIVERFIYFLKVAYGEALLEQNTQYVADSLYSDLIARACAAGRRTPRDAMGSARDVIRTYFLKHFYKEHCTLFKKLPIYWLLDAGPKHSFKALVYLHQYSPDTLARVRTDYVHEQQERYRTQLTHLREAEETARGAELTRINREIKKVSEQQTEIAAFEERLHRLADQMIELDLDDGVTTNYKKLSSVLAKVK